MDFTLEDLRRQAETALRELLEAAELRPGTLLVAGCSSSELVGGQIGHASNVEAAEAVFEGLAPLLEERGIYLAAQCCEHLNRALVVERECAERYGYEPVTVVPQPKAGGAFASTAWKRFREPVAVERIRAHAGLDIGGTLIGMHLREVAVPVRLSLTRIGCAHLTAAWTRPRLIGGERAVYR